jgi:hypothetical protein
MPVGAVDVAKVVDRVAELLALSPAASAVRWELLRDQVKPDTGDWYYIPILFPDSAPRDIFSYDFLVDVEDQIEREYPVHVLLVPAI